MNTKQLVSRLKEVLGKEQLISLIEHNRVVYEEGTYHVEAEDIIVVDNQKRLYLIDTIEFDEDATVYINIIPKETI